MNSKIIYPDSGAARSLSLLLAIGLTPAVLGWPHLMASAKRNVKHPWLTQLMWGSADGVAHRVGFVPHNRILRVLLNPIVIWGLPLPVLVALQLMPG